MRPTGVIDGQRVDIPVPVTIRQCRISNAKDSKLVKPSGGTDGDSEPSY